MKQFRNLLKMDLYQIADGGLGSVVLEKPSRGYVGFEASDDGLEFDITLSEGANREVFESVYHHSTRTLSRGAILRSTGPGNVRLRFTRRAVVQVVISAETMNDVVLALGGGLPTAPTILAQPQSVTVQPGVSAEFVVSAIGQAIQYQWRRDGEVILGATASSFVLASPTLDDSGAEFDCVLSNAGGTRTTEVALLTVQVSAVAPSAVTNLQAGAATTTEQPLTWGVPAIGTGPFTYQVAYRLGSSSGAFSNFGAPINGTSASVTGLSASTAYDYQVTAINAVGSGPAASLNDVSTAAVGAANAQPRHFRAPANAMTVGTQELLDGAAKFGSNGGKSGAFTTTGAQGTYGWYAALASAGTPVFTDVASGLTGGWASQGNFAATGGAVWQMWRMDYPGTGGQVSVA